MRIFNLSSGARMGDYWIEGLLSRWGRWAIKSSSGGLGYPPISPMFRERIGNGDGHGGSVDPGFVTADIIDCDDAVNKLPNHIKRVVIIHYQMCRSLRDTAKCATQSYSATRESLNYAHGFLSAVLDKGKFDNHNRA